MCSRRSSIAKQTASSRATAGFNLIELLMAMAMSTMIFMSITFLYTYQGEAIQEQNNFLQMHREARFAMTHLRRDMMSLGSNTTANSVIDQQVCPKPPVPKPLQAIAINPNEGFVYEPSKNQNIKKVSITLFGNLDVRTRYRTVAVAGDTVTLDDGDPTQLLPATLEAWNDTFTTDRFLRVSGADGSSFFYPIVSSSFSDKSIKLSAAPPQVQGAQRCGYQGFGDGLWVDVPGFVRYRIIADKRPGAPKDASNAWRRPLLVRERLGTDGTTVVSSLILAENVLELGVYDAGYDQDAAPNVVNMLQQPVQSDIVDGGRLSGSVTASPEQLRFLTVKLSVRAEFHNRKLFHKPRLAIYYPLRTAIADKDLEGAAPVITIGSRVTMPALVARNL